MTGKMPVSGKKGDRQYVGRTGQTAGHLWNATLL